MGRYGGGDYEADGDEEDFEGDAGSSSGSSIPSPMAIPPPRALPTPIVMKSNTGGSMIVSSGAVANASDALQLARSKASLPLTSRLLVSALVKPSAQLVRSAGGTSLVAARTAGAMIQAPTSGASMQGLGAGELPFDIKTLLIPAAVIGGGVLLFKLFGGKKKPKRESPTKVFNFG